MCDKIKMDWTYSQSDFHIKNRLQTIKIEFHIENHQNKFDNENDYKIKLDADQLINIGIIRQHWDNPPNNNPSINLKPTHFLSSFILPTYIGKP